MTLRNISYLLAGAVLASAMWALPAARPAEAQAPTATETAPAPDPKRLAPRLEGTDMVMGLAEAPVTIIEYASLTCPHCANFHTGTLPGLKTNYIDKGLVKFVYRDYPLDQAALAASMVARCSGPERYFAFLDMFFRQQTVWTRASTLQQVFDNLKRMTRVGGLSDQEFDACIANREVQDTILNQAMGGEREFQVRATPTIIINGKKHEGPHGFEDLDKVLRPLVGRS